MENKIKFLIICFVLSTGAASAAPISFKTAAVKFGWAMLGVLVSSLLLFLGLSLYNKIRNNLQTTVFQDEEITQTPKTKEQAVDFYINKNRLK